MNINISDIVAAKLAEMESSGAIQKAIETTVEKAILSAFTDEVNSYGFRKAIGEQVRKSVSTLAEDCGLPAYNGFIAEQVKSMVQELYSADIVEKLQSSLNDVLLQKHENIKLSDIFKAYRKWVLETTDESDKYEREKFTARLEVEEDGSFTWYNCYFAAEYYAAPRYQTVDIGIRFCVYRDKESETISSVYLEGHHLGDGLRIGKLSDFEAFVVNLFYNGTEIILDDVDEDEYYDIDI